MGENDWFFKFMCDLGTSGVWAKLSKAAKAVYPMLGIHTDGTFKPVYPSIPRLVTLTGLSKKGVEDGLRDLEAHGLIRRRSGKSHRRGEGNRPNIYEFAFEYAGSTLGYSAGKGLATQQPSPLATQRPTPWQRTSPEQESGEREQGQQQQPAIHLNVTLQQDESVAAAAIELLRRYFDDKAAQRLASKYPVDYIREKVNLVERRAQGSRLRNKPGYLRRALEDGWRPTAPELEGDRFQQLVAAIRRGNIREAVVGEIAWRAGIAADQRSIYLTHMTSGAQMHLHNWADCRDLQWR